MLIKINLRITLFHNVLKEISLFNSKSMLKCYNSLPFSLMGHILSGLLSHSLLVTDIDSSWHWQRQFWAPLKQVQLRAMYDPLSFLQKIVS